MTSSTANLFYELPHELPNDIRLRILGNKKILGKSQAQSPLQKLKPGNSRQKTRKSIYQTFLVLTSFTEFLYFVLNILSRIVWANKVLVLARPSLLQSLIFWHFLYHQSIPLISKENIKQVSCVKLTNLMALCKQ